MLEEALRYEGLGLSVVPVHSVGANGRCSCGSARCRSPGKHPRASWRASQSSRLTPEELRKALGPGAPKSNVGIVTGPISGVLVVDIDGEEGLESLRMAGRPLESLPVTPAVRTGGGGIHLYYRYPEGAEVKTAAGVLPKVDVRAQGGFVVAPPSVHKSGAAYEWVEGRGLGEVEIADLDAPALLGESPSKRVEIRVSTSWFEELLGGTPEGERNSSATRLAGRYLAMGLVPDEAEMLLGAWNQRNDPPLPDKEIRQVIKSVQKTGSQDRGLEWISGALGAEVTAVRRITGDEPKVILEFPQGTCTVTTAQLLSPVAFQAAVADATKVIVPKRSAKTSPSHEALAQAILRASVDEDAGLEATWVGELKSLVRDYVANQRMIPMVEGEPVPMSGPFRMDGRVWVAILDIAQRSSARWGVRIQNTTQMAQRLRSLGIEPKSLEASDGSFRPMWGVRELEVTT